MAEELTPDAQILAKMFDVAASLVEKVSDPDPEQRERLAAALRAGALEFRFIDLTLPGSADDTIPGVAFAVKDLTDDDAYFIGAVPRYVIDPEGHLNPMTA